MRIAYSLITKWVYKVQDRLTIDLDTYRSAKLLIDRHGEEAPIHGAMRADHVASTSALPPTADLRAAASAFRPIPSASPPGADLPDGAAVGPLMTRRRH